MTWPEMNDDHSDLYDWCNECETFYLSHDGCRCDLEIDLEADPKLLQRLNPDLDLSEEE